jgi:biotin synthase
MTIRHNWTRAEVLALADRPFADLIFAAQQVLRAHHAPGAVQKSRLLNIKTGGCPENCGYCSQSAFVETGLIASKLMSVEEVRAAAARAKAEGAERFCMGAAWRELKDRDLAAICAITKAVKSLGLETCMTLGMLTRAQADALAEAGLDYYNHNLDTGPEY